MGLVEISFASASTGRSGLGVYIEAKKVEDKIGVGLGDSVGGVSLGVGLEQNVESS